MEMADKLNGEEQEQLPVTEGDFARLIVEMYRAKELIENSERRHADRLKEYSALKSETAPEGLAWAFDDFVAARARIEELRSEMRLLRSAVDAAKAEIEKRRTLLASLFWSDCMSSPPVKVKEWIVKVIGGRVRVTTVKEYKNGEPEWL